MADPTTPTIFPKGTPLDEPTAAPQQITGYAAEQDQQQAQAARDKQLVSGNLAYRLGSGNWGLDLIKDALPTPDFKPDEGWQKPDIADKVFDGLGVNERVNLLADSHSEEELQYRMAQAHINDQRAQMLADSAWYTRADSMIAEGIKYAPLSFIPGVGEGVGLGRVGGFLVNLGKATAEGAAAQAYLERNDPNRSASDLLNGAITNVIVGSALHGAGLAAGRIGGAFREAPEAAPEAPGAPPAPPGSPSTSPLMIGWDGPVIRQGTDVPQPHLRDAKTEALMSSMRQGQMAGIEPESGAARTASAVGQQPPDFDPFNQNPQSSKDDWHDWYMLQRHLEIAKTNDAVDRGAVDPEVLPQESRDVLDAHRDVEQLHDEVNDAEARVQATQEQIEDEYTKQHLEQMEAAGEIPPKGDPKSQLLEAFRETKAPRGEKVALQDIMDNLPMEADEKEVLGALQEMERSGEVKLHPPKAPPKGALREDAEEQPDSYMVGAKDTSHVTFKKATTREEGKKNIANMRQSASKAETHAELAEALPDRSTAGLASEVKGATARAQTLRSRLDAETAFFSGKSSKVPERYQDEATPRDRADAQDMLKQRDVEEGRLPIPEKGDNVEPEQTGESLEEHAPKQTFDLTSSEASAVVVKARAKLAETRKLPDSPEKQARLQHLNGILEDGLDALAQARRREFLEKVQKVRDAAKKPTLEDIRPAYDKIVASQYGAPAVRISELHQATGIPIKDLHELIMKETAAGRMAISHSTAIKAGTDKELNAAAIHIPGHAEPFHMVRLKAKDGGEITAEKASASAVDQQITEAYDRIAARTGRRTVTFDKLAAESGLPLEKIHDYVRARMKTGEVSAHHASVSKSEFPEVFAAGLKHPSFDEPFVSMTRQDVEGHGLLDLGRDVSPEDRTALIKGTSALRKAITSTPGKYGVHQILDVLAQHIPLAQTLRELVPNIKALVHNAVNFDLDTRRAVRTGASGAYYHSDSGEFILLGKNADAHVALHEVVHAVTTRFINAFPDHPVVKQLKDLLERVRAETPHADAYGLTDEHELLAEGMTRPSFQNDLRGIKMGPQTGWEHFVDIIKGIVNAARRAIGLPEMPTRSANALEEVTRIFSEISKSQADLGTNFRYSSRGEALAEAHASMALPDPNEYGKGERDMPWTRGGRLNPARTNAQRLTDERTLTPLMAGIGSKLVEPVVGAARGVTNRLTALGVKLRVMHSALQQIDRSGAYFTRYLAEQGMSKAQQVGFRIKNFLNHEADYAFQKDVHDWGMNGKGQSQAAKKFNDEVVQPLLKQFRKDAQDADVPGAEHWKDDYGLPRVYDHVALDQVWKALGGTQGGDDAMSKIFSAAYQKTAQAMGLSQNVTDAIGAGIWQRLRAAYGGYDAYTGHGINLGDVDFLEKTLRASGLPGTQVQDALDELRDFRTERTGAMEGHTKQRLDLDMNTPVNAAGVQARTLADLLDKRAVNNLRHYSEGMGGQIGLSKMGIHTDADFQQLIAAGLKDALEQKNPQWATDQWENRMKAFFKAQMGQPLNDMESKEWAKVISSLATGFASSHLGVSGLPIWATNVTRNLGHGNALLTLKRIGEMTSTRDYKINPDTGEYYGAGVRAIMHLLGIQADPFSKRVFDHIHDGPRGLGDRTIDMMQTLANRAMQTVSSINPAGMTHAIRLGNKLSAMNAIQHMTDEMFGRSSNMGAGFKRWSGMNEDMWNKAVAGFKAAIPDIDKQAFGSSTQLNMGAFKAVAGDECMERVVAALRAQVGRRIHTADWGAASPFMENPLGRAVMQLRVFSFEAMAKQAGAGVNIGGREALSDAALMSLGGMAEFYIRSQINMAQMDDKERAKYVKQNLTPGKLIAAGISRNPMTTMASSLVDTVASPFGIGVFEGQRSSGLDNNLITGSPIYDGLNKSFAGFSDIAKSLEGQGQVTRRTLNNMNALNPLGNVIGVHALLNSMGDTMNLPNEEPRKARHAPPPESLTEAVFGNEPIQE